MNIATVQMRSRSLGRHVTYSAILPDAQEVGPGPYPVLYQLHGASDDHAAWLNRSNLARHVAKLPFLVVMPDGALSFWMNAGARDRYEDFIMQDLAQHLSSTYNVRAGKAAIGGLSMGGFGSLRLALKYPERFASVWAHSSAVWTEDEMAARGHVFPASAEGDIYALAVAAVDKELPVIGFDCGTEDFLIEQNRRFRDHLKQVGIAHTYREHTGVHNWDYWDLHVKDALEQHARVLSYTVEVENEAT